MSNAAQLAEACHADEVAAETSMVGPPTCAAIPAVMQSGSTARNLGCIGNQVYAGLDDDELYVAIAGSQLDNVIDKMVAIANANNALEKFHTV